MAQATGSHDRTAALRGLHPALLLVLYTALMVLPLLAGALYDAPRRRPLHEASSGVAMVGFAMMLVQFVLSGRFEALSGRFGIDLTMRFHQLAARTLLALLLLHPLLIALAVHGSDVHGVVTMLRRLFNAPAMQSGVVAWWLMLVVVIMGIFRDRLPMPYELWRASHGIGAAAIALFGTHHTLAVGRHSASAFIAGFWVVLLVVALGTLVWVYVVKPIRQRARPWRLVENRKVGERLWALAIEPEHDSRFTFLPGQFVWLTLDRSPFWLNEHPFSISSAPGALPRLEFLIKEAGDFTDAIGAIAEVAPAYLDGPYGCFVLEGYEAEGIALIAGGVGIAPMLSILRDLRARRDRRSIRLVYGNRAESQIVHRDELEAMTGELDLRLELVLSEPPDDWPGRVGLLDPAMLGACLDVERPERWLYLVCGPGPMMDVVERALLDLGIPGARIVMERFKYD